MKLGMVAPVGIPKEIWENHKHEVLAVDYLFIQGIPYLHSIGNTYKFRTIGTVKNDKRITNNDVIAGVKR